MHRLLPAIFMALILLIPSGTGAQENQSDEGTSVNDSSAIDGTWITNAGNKVEVKVRGTEADLYFPEFARHMFATFDGTTLVYITHYNDPDREECYIDVPDSEYENCREFIREGDPRHRFILTLNDDGRVLEGVKEINVLQCSWDVDENGNTVNHKPDGYEWEYFSDYQWRRMNCDFSGLPAVDGNVLEKYELIEILLDRFGLAGMLDFDISESRNIIRFNYKQDYIDSDTGEWIPTDMATEYSHKLPVDGRVYYDTADSLYRIELYPYAFGSYENLLSALSMTLHQLRAVRKAGMEPQNPDFNMQIAGVEYTWEMREFLCVKNNDEFEHHIDYLSRALRHRAMSEI